jgi:hypothetical protein
VASCCAVPVRGGAGHQLWFVVGAEPLVGGLGQSVQRTRTRRDAAASEAQIGLAGAGPVGPFAARAEWNRN